MRWSIFALILTVPVFVASGCVTTGGDTSGVFLEMRLATDEPAEGFMPTYIPATREKVYLSPIVELTEKDIKAAEVVRTPHGPAVGVKLTWSAARRLARLTDKHIGDRLAILVNGRIVSAPRIKGKTGRRMIIVSNFSNEGAADLAAALNGRPVRY